jgi:hypothetical protein
VLRVRGGLSRRRGGGAGPAVDAGGCCADAAGGPRGGRQRLIETQQVCVFGFPFGERLGKNATVSTSAVSSLREDQDGRITAVDVGEPYRKGEQQTLPITVETIDPLGRTEKVAVDCWLGDAAPPDRPEAGAAEGDLVLPLATVPGKVLWVQPVLVNGTGRLQWVAATHRPPGHGRRDVLPSPWRAVRMSSVPPARLEVHLDRRFSAASRP